MTKLRRWIAPLFDESVTGPILCSYARLVYGARPRDGIFVLLATLGTWAGIAGFAAVSASYAAARAMGYPRERIRAGQYGYNALLVGLALALGQAPSARVMTLVVGGAVLATFASAVLSDALKPHALPTLALPFTIVASLLGHTALPARELPSWLSAAPESSPLSLPELLTKALGAIVFQPTRWGGALIFLAVLLRSRILTATLLLGAAIGVSVVKGLDIEDAKISVAAAYNAALTCAGLGAVFFVPGRAALLGASVAAALAAWLSAAWMLPFAPLAVPVLAWPFVVVTLCWSRALSLRVPEAAPYTAPLPDATPETNVAYSRMLVKRLRAPSPPRFVLPVRGAWTVTQGFDGPHTHRGLWAHALDFEIVDQERFPFRGDGVLTEQYYCFGQPVFAPGAGTVVAIHGSALDNAPGAQDLAQPWGNAIVLQHGPALYSVLAHLQQGSIRVALGQYVALGEQLALCGSSGRSPRPHLHFQAQASPELGAHSIDFRISHYTALDGEPRFVSLGIPLEGETVQYPEFDPQLSGDDTRFPGRELALVDLAGRRTLLQREISWLGEHALVDSQRNERLYYLPHSGGVIFTSLVGSSRGPLGALMQTVPMLPATRVASLAFTEQILPAPLLPWPLCWLDELLELVGEASSACVSGRITRDETRVVVESECSISFLGIWRRRRRGRAIIDELGLASIELFDARTTPRLLFCMTRTDERAFDRKANPWRLEPSTVASTGSEQCAI